MSLYRRHEGELIRMRYDTTLKTLFLAPPPQLLQLLVGGQAHTMLTVAWGSQKGMSITRYSAMAVDRAVRAGSPLPSLTYSLPRPRWQWATSGRMPSSSARARACW